MAITDAPVPSETVRLELLREALREALHRSHDGVATSSPGEATVEIAKRFERYLTTGS